MIRILFLFLFLFLGCKHECNCGSINCGPNCVNQCEENRCIPGEKCCSKCTCNK